MNTANYLIPKYTQFLRKSTVVPRKRVEDLQKHIATLPQLPAMETTHFFAGGMYVRRMVIPADALIVSKVHKTEHHFIGCVGELHVWGQGEHYIVRPGDVIPSEVGTKRVVYAPVETIVMTVHKTDLTDPEEMEKALMEEDETALYDANNCPKKGVLTLLEGK